MPEILRTETLAKVRDGALAMALDQKLTAAFDDCYDRPQVRRPRTVTLSIAITPRMPDADEIDLSEAMVSFSVDAKIPAQSIHRTMQASRRNRGFRFESDTDSTTPTDGNRTFPELGDD